jgi:tetratricopeptide (TPR) repeat protein
MEAEVAFTQAEDLRLRGTADSLRKAIEKYEESLPLYRAAGNRNGEATALNNLGAVYNSLGEKRQAFASFEQSPPLRRAIGDRSDEAGTLYNIGRIYSDLGAKQQALGRYIEALSLYR